MKKWDLSALSVILLVLTLMGTAVFSRPPLSSDRGVGSYQKNSASKSTISIAPPELVVKNEMITAQQNADPEKSDQTDWPSWIQAIAAVVTFLATLAILTVSRGQLKIYHRQAKIMIRQESLIRRQAKASEAQTTLISRQLVAAIESAAATKETAEAATRASYADRAWLFIEGINHTDMGKVPDEEGIYRFDVRFKVRNYGSTPAVIKQVIFRAFSQIRFFGGEPDPGVLGPGVAEVEFGGVLREENSKNMYPMLTYTGVMINQNQVTIAPNSSTNDIVASGYFRDIPESEIPGGKKQFPWDNIYCLIVIDYLDLYRQNRQSSYYAYISFFRQPISPRNAELDQKYNYWT